jgi:hypothetical protein
MKSTDYNFLYDMIFSDLTALHTNITTIKNSVLNKEFIH